MRLGQLSRQLDIKSEKIISFLEKEKGIIIKEHPNSKVEDDLIELITSHFNPVIEEIEIKEVPVPETPTKEESKEDAAAPLVEPKHIETVKPEAPQELKIVGKIDLPDKSQINVEVDGVIYDQETLDNKKKEGLAADRERRKEEKEAKQKEEEERKAKAREQRKIEQERQAMLETEKNNILSQEEEKKKAIILKAQQDREKKLEEKRKAKQAEHYAKQFSPKTQTPKKKKKIAEEQTIEGEIQNQVKEEQLEEVKEKSAFKRFIKWLNT